MSERRILGLHLTDRIKEATRVQEILTEYGCYIKTRLGLHEVVKEHCSTTGLILLELTGELEQQQKLEDELKKIEHLDMQKMVFKE